MPEPTKTEWTPKVVNLDDHDPKKGWLKHGSLRLNTSGVILHSTAGSSLNGALGALRDAGYAYDFIIDKDGTIYKCVPFNHKTSHAGASIGWKGPNCNKYTIGISFVNPNDGKTHITPQQNAAVRWLLKTQIAPAFPYTLRLTTHYGTSFPRKTDPQLVNARSIAEDSGLIYWPGRRKD